MTANIEAAKEYVSRSDYRKAVQFAAKACFIDEQNMEVRYLKSFCYRNLGEFSKAIDTYRQIIELMPGSAVAHLYLADCLKNAGQTEEAIQVYLQSIKLDTEGDISELARESIVNLKESLKNP